MTLRIVPVSFADAADFVSMWHRHHQPPNGHRFSLGVARGDTLVGVCIVSHPVARHLMDGQTLEVIRSATDGTRNANSMLYAAAWRAAKALGYTRLVTYTLSRTCRHCHHGEGDHEKQAGRPCTDEQCACPGYAAGEGGESLRAAGFRVVGERSPRRGWSTPSRPRDDSSYLSAPRTLWEVEA